MKKIILSVFAAALAFAPVTFAADDAAAKDKACCAKDGGKACCTKADTKAAKKAAKAEKKAKKDKAPADNK